MAHRALCGLNIFRDATTAIEAFKADVVDSLSQIWLAAYRQYDIMISYSEELPMAQFIVRNLEDDVKARLKRRAARHGRSMEAEVRHILRDAVKGQNQPIAKLGSRIAARFAKTGLTTDLPELRGQAPLSAEFDK